LACFAEKWPRTWALLTSRPVFDIYATCSFY
jgi:hypothetical protein